MPKQFVLHKTGNEAHWSEEKWQRFKALLIWKWNNNKSFVAEIETSLVAEIKTWIKYDTVKLRERLYGDIIAPEKTLFFLPKTRKDPFFDPKQLIFFVMSSNFVLQNVKQNDMCKQCRPRSDCSWRSSLIRVYTVCHSTKYFNKQLYKRKS